MTEHTTILVAVRYPLTDESARTLVAAGRLASDRAPATLTVLNVNLYQNRNRIRATELAEGVASTLDDIEASIDTRQGFVTEQEILEEATQIGADIIVVGANHQSLWKRVLRRLLQGGPGISTFLVENTTSETEIMEVNATGVSAVARPV